MKKITYVFLISILASSAHAQVAGTKWNTTLQMDQPVNVVFNFSTDTLNVNFTEDNSNLETMKFFIQDTVIILQKLYGQSDCDTTIKGVYSYKINNNEMSLRLISDDCFHRSDVLKNLKLIKSE